MSRAAGLCPFGRLAAAALLGQPAINTPRVEGVASATPSSGFPSEKKARTFLGNSRLLVCAPPRRVNEDRRFLVVDLQKESTKGVWALRDVWGKQEKTSGVLCPGIFPNLSQKALVPEVFEVAAPKLLGKDSLAGVK